MYVSLAPLVQVVHCISATKYPGDCSISFVSDVIGMSLGVLSAEERITAVWRVPIHYDPYVISCTRPVGV
jgi:hypothetical protein